MPKAVSSCVVCLAGHLGELTQVLARSAPIRRVSLHPAHAAASQLGISQFEGSFFVVLWGTAPMFALLRMPSKSERTRPRRRMLNSSRSPGLACATRGRAKRSGLLIRVCLAAGLRSLPFLALRLCADQRRHPRQRLGSPAWSVKLLHFDRPSVELSAR